MGKSRTTAVCRLVAAWVVLATAVAHGQGAAADILAPVSLLPLEQVIVRGFSNPEKPSVLHVSAGIGAGGSELVISGDDQDGCPIVERFRLDGKTVTGARVFAAVHKIVLPASAAPDAWLSIRAVDVGGNERSCHDANAAGGEQVSAQPCEPGWDVGIGNPGLSSGALAFLPHDLGTGDRMLVGGFFLEPYSALAAWDGQGWSTFGSPAFVGDVFDIKLYDDGNGEKLYILGNLYIGGNKNWHVARLDEGNQWTFLDNGDPANGVSEMIVWDDGTGPGLYVTGDFVTLDGVTTHNDIARWDGTNWTPLNNGLNFSGTQIGLTFEVYDDGNGEKLYLGGTFNRVDGQHIDYLAAWDGQEWSEPWFGTGPNDSVKDLCVYDDGNGPALYAVGCFEVASGELVSYVAKYDGTGWYDLDGGTVSPGCLNACGVYDEGDGPNLFVSGSLNDASGKPMKKIARWDGAEWHSPDGGITSGQGAFAMLGLPPDSPFGSTMFVGGAFTGVGGQTSNYIAEYRGCHCRPDLNNDGTVNTQDFLTFLNLWVAQDPIADWNTDGTINTQDFLAYLNEWVAGC